MDANNVNTTQNSNRRLLIFCIIAVTVTVLTEVFLFNCLSFKLIGGDYTQRTLNISDAKLTGFNAGENGTYVSNYNGRCTVEFNNLDCRVGTIRLDVYTQDAVKTPYIIDYTDESNSGYTYRTGLVDGTVIEDAAGSRYVSCQFSGKVGSLKIKFDITDSHRVILESNEAITLNAPVPFRFSFIRVALILFILLFIYTLLYCDIMKTPISKAVGFRIAATVIFCISAVAIGLVLATIGSEDVGSDFKMTEGDQMTKELVDAFKKKQVWLDLPADSRLAKLENPYDRSQRAASGAQVSWDHVYFQGKYYSYYGIAPVILLFLPYNLLTGFYAPGIWAVFLFGALGVVFLGLFWNRFCRRFFPDIPIGIYICTFIMIEAICGVWYCFPLGKFYEIAQSSSFCFVAMGAYFLVSTQKKGGGTSLLRLALSSTFLSLAVLCRPTSAMWCVAALVIIILGIRNYLDNYQTKKVIRTVIYLAVALLPFALIGSVQMAYNYLRFGSVLEFGIKYSFTISDFTNSEFHLLPALIGFYNFFLAAPIVKPEFPFIFSNFNDLGVNTYYYKANYNAVGLFFRALPTFFLFAAPREYNELPKPERRKYGIIWTVCTVIVPVIIVASIWESGYGVRYCMDFYWQMLAGALTVLFLIYRRCKSDQGKRLLYGTTVISSVLCLLTTVALIFDYVAKMTNDVAIIKEICEFWH